jgi:uncharacterized protein (DUF58 family)
MWVAWLILILLAIVLMLAPRQVRAQARWVAQPGRLFPGRSGLAQFRLEVYSPWPIWVRLELPGQPGLSMLPEGAAALVWGRWHWQISHPFLGRQRGVYPLPEPQLWVRDLWGLRESRAGLTADRIEVVVYPAHFDLESPKFVYTLLADGPPAPQGLEDASRQAGIRSYQSGDPLSRLHWKATARHGQPMVRQFEQVRSSGLWVHLDLNQFPGGTLGKYYLEHATALAASLLIEADRRGLACGLSAGPQQRPPQPGQLELLLEQLARLENAPREQAQEVPLPPPGINLVILSMLAPQDVIGGALKARARASRVHLVVLPEGYYLQPGQQGRAVFGQTDGVLRLHTTRRLLEAEGVRVHLIRGNQEIQRIAR